VAKRKKPWSKVVRFEDPITHALGAPVRIYERAPGSVLAREVRISGRKDRKSLGHRDRAHAERDALELSHRLAEGTTTGTGARVTLGQLVTLYRQHHVASLPARRARAITGVLTLLERHFGRGLILDDLAPAHVERYVAARRSGALRAPRHRTADAGVRTGTIKNEIARLRAILRWGEQYKVESRPLVSPAPRAAIAEQLPQERNPMRPVATDARYQALLAVADQAERDGRFRCVLTLARETGRRINAICQLRMSDILLTREHMVRALAANGLSETAAAHWPHGAIHWRKASDKKGYDLVAPLSKAARQALDTYIRRGSRAGDVPLFPGQQDSSQPITKETASYWLTRAERLAELPHLARGGFHPFRRLWASERRHLPDTDVAAAGGWASIKVMRESYQHSDAATIYAVVDRATATETDPKGPSRGHTLDTPSEQVAQ